MPPPPSKRRVADGAGDADADGDWEQIETWEADLVMLVRDDVSDFNEENILPQPPEVIKDIRTWLKPTKYNEEGSEYRKHLECYLDGTCAWLHKSAAFVEWQESSEQGMLWLRGIPGSGKSVLAASLICRLAQDTPVLYFFFRQIIDANHDALTAVRDFLDQILEFSPPLQLALKTHLDKHRDRESMSTGDMWRLLQLALSHIPKAYLVVDALDEMDRNKDAEHFIELLTDLAKWRPSQIKVVITSRPVPYVERPLMLAKTFNIWLEEQIVDIDIATYVDHCLTQSSIPLEHHNAIKAAVPGRANGLFLYAKLAMDRFLSPGADIDEVLKLLPMNLAVMYTDLLQEHRRRSGVTHEMQLLLLQWVTHANRPLRLLELAEMINVTQFEEERRDLKAAKDLVRTACGPLLEVLPDETVCVVHHSLTEFLNGSVPREIQSYPVLDFGSTHAQLALTCLRYMQSGTLQQMEPDAATISQHKYNPTVPSPWSPNDNIRENGPPPFLRYATSQWHVHARKATLAGADQTAVNAAIDACFTPENLQIWAPLERIGKNGRVTALLMAATVGLPAFMEVLLSRPTTEIDKDVGEHHSPICQAAMKGYDDIVQLLIQHGMVSGGSPHPLQLPLYLAAERNWPKVIEVLLAAGATPFKPLKLSDRGACGPGRRRTRPRRDRYCPVEAACRHSEAFRVILSVCETTEQAKDVLYASVRWKQPAAVRLVLEMFPSLPLEPTKPDNETEPGISVLHMACWNHDSEIISILLEAGADPNEQVYRPGPNVLFDTPLYSLFAISRTTSSSRLIVKEPFFECLKLLIDAGADVNQVDGHGRTVLSRAKDARTVQVLLDAGLDPNIVDKDGNMIFDLSINVDVIRPVLETGTVDVNRPSTGDNNCKPPLIFALQRSKLDLALLLLEHGAKVDFVDDQGNGVFHYAARALKCDEVSARLVAALGEAGADISARNHEGHTPLHGLSGISDNSCFSNGAIDNVVSRMVSAGADLEARDYQGCTPFLNSVKVASYSNCLSYLNTFANAGARLDVRDREGRSALHLLVERTSDVRSGLRFLVDQGLDPHATDNGGNTLWHAVLPRYSRLHWGQHSRGQPRPTVDIHSYDEISPYGVDIQQPNRMGQTPLHIVSMYRATGLDDTTTPYQQHYTALDYVLEKAHNVNCEDNNGVTPLHLASTFCEYSVARLLEHGADPSKTTHEGLTVLHHAARCRQPNVLGMILESLHSRYSQEDFATILNATTNASPRRTALHFACTSGRPESVKILLEAGAAHFDTDCSLLEACADFEIEDKNWLEKPVYDAGGCGSVLLDGNSRPAQKGWGRPPPSERLDEILQLLMDARFCTMASADDALLRASSWQSDYTVRSLLKVRKAYGLNAFAPPPIVVQAMERASTSLDDLKIPQKEANLSQSQREWEGCESLLRLREYTLLGDYLSKKNCLEFIESPPGFLGDTFLHRLIEGGYASILAQVATREHVRCLEDWTWCDQAAAALDGVLNPDQILPLLHAACSRDIPNMTIIEILVEGLDSNVNAQTRQLDVSHYSAEGPIYLADGGVLHHIVKANVWWQAAQAIPYLVQHGADLELRDSKGQTPLNAALENSGNLRFNRRAVEELLRLGADPNARDNNGLDCLSRAGDNINLLKLLIAHGAVVTPTAIREAVSLGHITVLEALLSSGGDPNTRHTKPVNGEDDSMKIRCPPWVNRKFTSEDEMFPLHLATSPGKNSTYSVKKQGQIVQTLLKHGADPMARYEDSTVMHQILEKAMIIRPFLGLPKLDLEARDSWGNTLLLIACGSSHTYAVDDYDAGAEVSDGKGGIRLLMPVEMLLRRGADVHARDHAGNTALHVFLKRTSGACMDHELGAILEAGPDLVNEKDPQGNTALHLFWNQNGDLYSKAKMLCDAGADVTLSNAEGNTALHLATGGLWWQKEGKISGWRKKIWKKLLAAGADVNARNAEGETPIFSFFRHGRVDEMVKKEGQAWLVPDRVRDEALIWEMFDRAGVDWKATNVKGVTLLHVVAGNNTGWPETHIKRFEFLLGKGLDPAAEDWRQRTPVDWAAEGGAKEVLKLYRKDGMAAGSRLGAGGVKRATAEESGDAGLEKRVKVEQRLTPDFSDLPADL